MAVSAIGTQLHILKNSRLARWRIAVLMKQRKHMMETVVESGIEELSSLSEYQIQLRSGVWAGTRGTG